MEIIIDDKKIRKLLKEKQVIIKQIRIKGETAIELNEDLNKLTLKRNNIIAKVHKIMDKKKFDLGEFEEIGSIELKDDKLIVKSIDVVEAFKKNYLEGKKNNDTKK